MCCLHLLANHRLAWEFKRILLTEALVLCFRLGLSSTSGIGEHVEELYCVPVRYAVEFRAALFAVVFEPLGKNVVQKKNPNCPGWFWHSSGWCLTSSCPATIACFSWVTLEAHLFLHKESATAWVRVRSQDKRRWAWSHDDSWGHLMLWMKIYILMAHGHGQFWIVLPVAFSCGCCCDPWIHRILPGKCKVWGDCS